MQLHLRDVVSEIRSRILLDDSRPSSPDETLAALLPLRDEIAKLGYSYEHLCSIRHNVGRMPPSPNTLRARLGGFLVRIVRQMLFWYTPQVHAFHDGAVQLGENLCAVVQTQYAALQRLHAEIADLRSELRVHAAAQLGEPAPAPLSGPGVSDPGYQHLLFSLRNRHAGPGESRVAELQEYAAIIEQATPPAPGGPWLDLGCGRGDWLAVASAKGREAIGLEDNVAAIEHCRARGFNVIAGDPLATLERMNDDACSVVAALQLVDRRSPPEVARLLRAAARVLRPGGFLLFEALNPASLVGGAEELWADPAVTRPWPVSTAEFFLQYFGLDVVSRLQFGPYSAGERLPFGELEFIRQLNSRLYAPRRYALLARRPAALGGLVA